MKTYQYKNWVYNGQLMWVGIDPPTHEEFKDKENVMLEIKKLIQKDARAALLAATDWTELPSQDKPEWVAWRQAVREWKQADVDCPIPPNENEYCLQEIWDLEAHKPKLIVEFENKI